jgi:hypothetical protein
MMSWSAGKRSKTPERMRRRVWMAVSECQPQPAMERRKPVSPGRLA